MTYLAPKRMMPVKAKTTRRDVRLSKLLDERLVDFCERHEKPITTQIRRALKHYIATPHDRSHRMLIDKTETSRIMSIEDTIWETLRERKAETGLDLDEQMQVAVTQYLDKQEEIDKKLTVLGLSLGMPPEATSEEIVPQLIRISDEMAGGVNLLKLPRTPCGPWKEALEETESTTLPCFIAELIGAREGDLLVPTGGQSMREAGVPDNGLVVMRKLDGAKPEIGSIVLACAERNSGAYFYTIKFWYQDAAGKPELRDGKLKIYHLPPDAEPKNLKAVAVLVGVIGRATIGGTVKGRRPPEKRVRGEKWEYPESE